MKGLSAEVPGQAPAGAVRGWGRVMAKTDGFSSAADPWPNDRSSTARAGSRSELASPFEPGPSAKLLPTNSAGDRIPRADLLEFRRLLDEATPRVVMTPVLVLACVAVSIAMAVSGL